MNINRLRYFIVVAETESIRKAAEILHISPAALSKAIKQLEYETGIKLLIPSGRGVIISDAGLNLARSALPLIKELEGLTSAIKEKNKLKCVEENPVRIGSFEIFTTHFLSLLINFISYKPDLFLYELMPGEIEINLLEYEIDYGITYFPVSTAGIIHKKIAYTDMAIFRKKNCFEKIPFKDLPFVAPIQPVLGAPNKPQEFDGWPDSKLNRLTKFRVTMLESALELCRQGLCVVYLPTFIAHLHNKTVKAEFQLQMISFPKELPIHKQAIYIAKRKADPETQLFNKIDQAIRAVCKI